MPTDAHHLLALIALIFAVLGGGAGFWESGPRYAGGLLLSVAVILLAVAAFAT